MSANIGAKDIVTEGLVLYLDAANYKSYTSGSTVWRDMSSNAYSGSLLNGTSFDTLNGGNIVFDGTDDRVSISNFPLQIGNIDYSIEINLYVSAIASNYGISLIGSGPFNINGKGLEIRFQNNQFEYTLADGLVIGSRLQYTFSSVADGKYKQIVITQIKQGLATLYVNGVSLATKDYSTITPFTNTYTAIIGRGTDTTLNGKIATYKIYNRALSAQEILQNYNALKGRFGLT